jgi:hypothetical protein
MGFLVENIPSGNPGVKVTGSIVSKQAEISAPFFTVIQQKNERTDAWKTQTNPHFLSHC